MNENPNQKVPKVCAALAQKSIKNEMNKLVIKCSVCSKSTELPFKKANRPKPVKLNNSQKIETPQNNFNHKKKKKKSRDKTAGLNISGYTPESRINKKNNSITSIKSPVVISKIVSNPKLSTSTKKSKKFSIERLKHIMANNATPTKGKTLRNFLAEL